MRQNLKLHCQSFLHCEGSEITCSCGAYTPALIHTECLVETAGKHVNELTKEDFDDKEQKTIDTVWECACGNQHTSTIHPPTIDKITIETKLDK